MMRPDEEQPLDLSALALDPGRFEALVAGALARRDALAARGPLDVIAGWSRPLLAAAAALVVALVPVEWLLERRESHSERLQRLVTLSSNHAYSDEPPSAAELLRALSIEVAR